METITHKPLYAEMTIAIQGTTDDRTIQIIADGVPGMRQPAYDLLNAGDLLSFNEAMKAWNIGLKCCTEETCSCRGYTLTTRWPNGDFHIVASMPEGKELTNDEPTEHIPGGESKQFYIERIAYYINTVRTVLGHRHYANEMQGRIDAEMEADNRLGCEPDWESLAMSAAEEYMEISRTGSLSPIL